MTIINLPSSTDMPGLILIMSSIKINKRAHRNVFYNLILSQKVESARRTIYIYIYEKIFLNFITFNHIKFDMQEPYLCLAMTSKQRRQANYMKPLTNIFQAFIWSPSQLVVLSMCQLLKCKFVFFALAWCSEVIIYANKSRCQIFYSSLDLTHNSISKCSLLLCILSVTYDFVKPLLYLE